MSTTFESFVNSERCKTTMYTVSVSVQFESFVNSERCKTAVDSEMDGIEFESFVNSERCKTKKVCQLLAFGLRALLIQKDVKQRKW